VFLVLYTCIDSSLHAANYNALYATIMSVNRLLFRQCHNLLKRRERERETDRQTDRQTDRESERERERMERKEQSLMRLTLFL